MLLKHDLDDVRTSSNNLDALVNLVDEKGRTVLHYAADSKRPALIAKLLNEFEADPNLMDYEGCSPLHICASKGI
jgi:ankyrin repeat protein